MASIELKGKYGDWHQPESGTFAGERTTEDALKIARLMTSNMGAWMRVVDGGTVIFERSRDAEGQPVRVG